MMNDEREDAVKLIAYRIHVMMAKYNSCIADNDVEQATTTKWMLRGMQRLAATILCTSVKLLFGHNYTYVDLKIGEKLITLLAVLKKMSRFICSSVIRYKTVRRTK